MTKAGGIVFGAVMALCVGGIGIVESQTLDARVARAKESRDDRAARLKTERWQDYIGDGPRAASMTDCQHNDRITISHNDGSGFDWNRFCYGRDNAATYHARQGNDRRRPGGPSERTRDR